MGMDSRFHELETGDMGLHKYPFAARGSIWGQRGGLGMNAHKYMRNVLPETEFFLGLALLFDKEVQDDARANLHGCWMKRKLESARWLLLAGLAEMNAVASVETFLRRRERTKRIEEHAATAKELLQRGAGNKEGWGWAVNNGDIFIAMGALEVLSYVVLLQLQMEPPNPSADPDDETLDQAKTLLSVAGLQMRLQEAESIWKNGLERTSTNRNGQEYHPWQRHIDEISKATGVATKAESPAAHRSALSDVLQGCNRLVDDMSAYFEFPKRASARQLVDAHEVVPWLDETTSSDDPTVWRQPADEL